MTQIVWEEPDGAVKILLGDKQTIVVCRGEVTNAADIDDWRGYARPRRIRPTSIGVRYMCSPDGWSMEVTIGGPTVRTDGKAGMRTAYVTYYPGMARPPWWAAAFAVDHHPDPENMVRWGDPS